MDYLSQPWLISLIAVSLCMAIGLCVAAIHIRRLYRVQHAMELIVKELIKTRDSSKKKFGELQSVSLGTGQKLIELERKLVSLNEVQQEMSVQTPENKLYSRAVKMVELVLKRSCLNVSCQKQKQSYSFLYINTVLVINCEYQWPCCHQRAASVLVFFPAINMNKLKFLQ